MTYKDAMTIIKRVACGHCRTRIDDGICKKNDCDVYVAIKALKKQIPRTMNLTMKGFLNCPRCKRDIRYPLVENIHYCPYCGQALKWGDENDRT